MPKTQKNTENKERLETKQTDERTQKLCTAEPQGDEIAKAYKALGKLHELLSCGDKRIELSAAKEILSLLGVPEELSEEGKVSKLEVEIKIV